MCSLEYQFMIEGLPDKKIRIPQCHEENLKLTINNLMKEEQNMKSFCNLQLKQ